MQVISRKATNTMKTKKGTKIGARKRTSKSTKKDKLSDTAELTIQAASQKGSKRTRVRLMLDEMMGVMLWVTSVFWLFFITSTQVLHHAMPQLSFMSSQQQFLLGIAMLLGVWERFDLSFGSFINPAVAFSQLLVGRSDMGDFVFGSACQFLGSLLAVVCARWSMSSLVSSRFWNTVVDGDLSIFSPPQPHASVSWQVAVMVEALITAGICFLSLSLSHVMDTKALFRKWYVSAGVIVGLMAMAADWTGGCMNPAVSFALAYTEQSWKMHSVYWVGPYCGAILASLFHIIVIERRWSTSASTQSKHKQN